MGANCCVAVKDKPLPSPTQFEVSTYRNIRHSPTWSFRWDNRTHIEDVMDNTAQFSHHHSENVGLEIKGESPAETESLSARGSPNAFRLQKQHKSPTRTGTAGKSKDVAADNQFIGSNSSPEIKGSTELSYLASASDTKLSVSVPSTPSSSAFRADLSPSKSHSLPSDPTSSRKACRSPGYQLPRQISDSRIPSLQSLDENDSPEGGQSFVLSSCSNDLSAGGSHGGSSDGWSMRTFSELVASSNRERWSFDSVNLTFSSSKRTRSNPQQTTQLSPDRQNCRVCSKLLTEYCVVAVLFCGHLYHAECLEKMTAEVDRYDPPCPVCTHGEKSAAKLFKKVETKARNKPYRIGVVDTDAHGVVDTDAHGDAHPDRQGRAGKGLMMGASSSMKSFFVRPFLRRNSSMGRPSQTRSTSESESNRKKGFWERYRRE